MHNYRGLEVGSDSRDFVYGDDYREVDDRIELLSVFDGGLVVFDAYSSNEFGGAYLSDLGLESLDYFK